MQFEVVLCLYDAVDGLCDERIINAQEWWLECCFMSGFPQKFSIQMEESFHYSHSAHWHYLLPNRDFPAFLSFDADSRWFLPFTLELPLTESLLAPGILHIKCNLFSMRSICWLWWAAFPPFPPRWCCNRGFFQSSLWPSSKHVQ